jgi:hypothetical protein
MFRNDFDMKMAVGNIEYQIMKDENERKMSVLRDLKEKRRNTFSPLTEKKEK